ncbi:MAG: hypothetical protein K0Q67_3283 [Cellvibrio sp.]|nr:hypothetical protein [Cellvibrio sp.]
MNNLLRRDVLYFSIVLNKTKLAILKRLKFNALVAVESAYNRRS